MCFVVSPECLFCVSVIINPKHFLNSLLARNINCPSLCCCLLTNICILQNESLFCFGDVDISILRNMHSVYVIKYVIPLSKIGFPMWSIIHKPGRICTFGCLRFDSSVDLDSSIDFLCMDSINVWRTKKILLSMLFIVAAITLHIQHLIIFNKPVCQWSVI